LTLGVALEPAGEGQCSEKRRPVSIAETNLGDLASLDGDLEALGRKLIPRGESEWKEGPDMIEYGSASPTSSSPRPSSSPIVIEL